jgi:phospholipase/lecithinase/hemolysin
MIGFFQLPRPLVVLTLALVFAAPSTAFTDVYFFGGSATDTGNSGPIDGTLSHFPSEFGYDLDRWTNAGGTLWPEGLAAGLGFSEASVASSDGGNNYATSGQRADEMALQIAALTADVGGPLNSNALYAIWTGGNDLIQFQTAASTVTDVTSAILSLAALGAKDFLVLNYYDFSLIPPGGPLADLAPLPPDADVWVSDFNSGLASALAGLSGVNIYQYDVASLINGIFADPIGAGFAAGLAFCTEDADCINGIGTEDFVMMDHLHLMSGPNQLIAADALATVTEPVPVPSIQPIALYTLLPGLLIGVGLMVRRRY